MKYNFTKETNYRCKPYQVLIYLLLRIYTPITRYVTAYMRSSLLKEKEELMNEETSPNILCMSFMSLKQPKCNPCLNK